MKLNERQRLVLLAVLRFLDQLDGAQAVELVMHAAVNLQLTPGALLWEFDEAVNAAEARRWIIGVRGSLGTVKWRITDLGRSVLKEVDAR